MFKKVLFILLIAVLLLAMSPVYAGAKVIKMGTVEVVNKSGQEVWIQFIGMPIEYESNGRMFVEPGFTYYFSFPTGTRAYPSYSYKDIYQNTYQIKYTYTDTTNCPLILGDNDAIYLEVRKKAKLVVLPCAGHSPPGETDNGYRKLWQLRLKDYLFDYVY